jgi:hypothetical protein
MKEQIKTTTASNRPAGFLRRGALKLLLAAFVVLGSIGTPTQARAQIVDPGTGILPPEPQEVVTRGYRPKQKSTKITDPTPVFMVQNHHPESQALVFEREKQVATDELQACSHAILCRLQLDGHGENR